MATYTTSAYHDDSDADDEFERSAFVSPTLPPDLDASDSDDMPSSPELTPTTFIAHSHSLNPSPTGLITQWTADQCADWVASLGLAQYAESFVDEAINGMALVLLQHHDLKEMGITSVGHRLTLLKGVYEIKMKQNVPFDAEHYVPLSAEQSAADMNATQDDIARIIESIRLRDQRIMAAELEMRALREHFDRLSEENRKLREDTLPVIRMVKDRSQPLPQNPDQLSTPAAELKPEKTSSLSRKFSTKKLFLGGAPKNPSPTIDPSAAALAAQSHLNPSFAAQNSPNQLPQHSPTSPAYSTQATSAGNRSFTRDTTSSSRPSYVEDAHHSYASYAPSTTAPSTRRGGGGGGGPITPTPAPVEDPPNSAPLPSSRDKDNPQVEIFKSFRVSIEDPCYKVLPVALKRYNIADDWRQYALYIVYGDQERCLGLEEKPLLLFKQLDREGRKPMFMLRKHASPAGEGWSNGTGGRDGAGGQGERVGVGGQQDSRALPGGVL